MSDDDVVRWLESPEGEQWSDQAHSPVPYVVMNPESPLYSIKEDSDTGWAGYSEDLMWGHMPGDDRLFREAYRREEITPQMARFQRRAVRERRNGLLQQGLDVGLNAW
jgi:hypothetical protein